MNAHQLDAHGVIINTIVVNSLDALPNLVDASIGGQIGDSIVSGAVVRKPPRVITDDEHDAAIEVELTEVERVAVRALLLDDKIAIAALKAKATELIAKLKKPK